MGQLMELLCIEKEAVYRRLRKDVAFSFAEIEQIARHYSISLDHIIENHSMEEILFHLLDYDFFNIPEEQIQYTDLCIKKVSTVKNDPSSELGFAYNTLPLNLVKSREHGQLYLFTLYKWMYQYGKYAKLPPFREINVSEQLLHFNDLYRKAIMQAGYTYYIFDEKIFQCLVNDILYFRKIKYITTEDTEVLKQELFDLLDYIENIAIHGEFETGKKVDLYITQMSIESSYSYISSKEHCCSYVKLVNLNDLFSMNPNSIAPLKGLAQSLKKSSVKISVSGEMERIHYFERQRNIIKTL
ncbi:MAG: hypothetical protein LUE93_04855 [Bacteroides sp.]|nr:hypothetical protein [Bacteroides sp.]